MQYLNPQTDELEFHPLCELFPEMSDEEYGLLCESIKQAGRVFKPIIPYEGKILDGRHRWQGAEEEGFDNVDDDTFEFDPDKFKEGEDDEDGDDDESDGNELIDDDKDTLSADELAKQIVDITGASNIDLSSDTSITISSGPLVDAIWEILGEE